MNFTQALDYIHSFERFGWDLGLERMQYLLDHMGNPQNRLRCIHVAGSNGKGSTCNMTATALIHAGYKVGLYTSPFVVDFRERFQINHEMIEEQTFADYTTRLKTHIDAVNADGIHITEFEAITALAFLWFAEQECDFLVLEVGLGGRFDATNVIADPLITAVTSISLDHTNILGDTIEKIAFEKAGILKQGSICCAYPDLHIDALAVLLEQCANKNCRLVQTNLGGVEILRCNQSGNRFTVAGKQYQTALVGKHQIYNACLVLDILQQLRLKGVAISDESMAYGLANTRFPARFEVLSTAPYVVIDGAHNPEGTAGLSATLQKMPCRKIVVMGMLADKDYAESVATIAKQADVFYAVLVNSPRALDPAVTATVAQQYCSAVQAQPDLAVAIEHAFAQLHGDDLLLVCGSLYMAGDARALLLEKLQ